MEKVIAKIEHLKVCYGALEAVKDVSLTLYQGETLAIIGPNGSGKTSVIECLEGLRKPTGGEVWLSGENPYRNRKKLYENVGVQLQETVYPEKIRVKELCRLFSAFYKDPADWKALLKQLGLAEKENRTVRKLSGGEKQRLSILLALLPKPELLILDELTTGLDPEVRHGMWESLKLLKQLGTTILFVTHYLDEAAYLADRLVYFENGYSAFTGTVEEFRAYAKNKAKKGEFRENMTLEEVYLLLSPEKNVIQLEGIL